MSKEDGSALKAAKADEKVLRQAVLSGGSRRVKPRNGDPEGVEVEQVPWSAKGEKGEFLKPSFGPDMDEFQKARQAKGEYVVVGSDLASKLQRSGSKFLEKTTEQNDWEQVSLYLFRN